MTPHTFGRWKMVRKLPAGGMGRVFEAIDSRDGLRVALKLIDRGTDRDSIEIVAAERHGALLQQQLCVLDRRITAVTEFGDLEDYFYIVMEYVEGQDLSELAAQERIGYLFAARIAQDVLEALSHAHNFRTTIEEHHYHGIVHGDIKPRNIRLTTVGQVKVLDFGIAKALSLTRRFTQNQFGSVQYSSPERLNSGEVTVSSDLWSVAAVLYELMARRPLFQAETGPKLEHLVRTYRELPELPEAVPADLQRIIRTALAPDSATRYQSAADFAADLEAFRKGEPIAERASVATADLDATRRTGTRAEEQPTDDVDATRRTSGSVVAEPPLPQPVAKPQGPHVPPGAIAKPRVRVTKGRIVAALFLALGLWVGYLVMNEYSVWSESRDLASDLEAERLRQMDVAWARYQKLASRANAGMSLWSAQDALRRRLLGEADRVITEYRVSNAPSVSETEWVQARQSAARALELMPRDKEVRGKLRLIDGHLNRIRGTAGRKTKVLEAARDNFNEAAELLSKSPDPWLGLARLYVYSLRDVEKAEEALREADRRGFELGKRESAQLADGYRDRGESLLREARRVAGTPEEERLLDKAEKDFERAHQLYESIVPFGDATVSLRRASEGIANIERRRAEREMEQP